MLNEKNVQAALTYPVYGTANDKAVKIWSPFTGELIRNLNGHTKGLSDIAWSSDSVNLASASDDHTVRIWEVDTVRLLLSHHPETQHPCVARQGLTQKVLKGHTSFVFCVNYNNASNLLVSGGCDGEIRIWNVEKGMVLPSCFQSSFALTPRRQMLEKDPCSPRLCHRRSL